MKTSNRYLLCAILPFFTGCKNLTNKSNEADTKKILTSDQVRQHSGWEKENPYIRGRFKISFDGKNYITNACNALLIDRDCTFDIARAPAHLVEPAFKKAMESGFRLSGRSSKVYKRIDELNAEKKKHEAELAQMEGKNDPAIEQRTSELKEAIQIIRTKIASLMPDQRTVEVKKEEVETARERLLTLTKLPGAFDMRNNEQFDSFPMQHGAQILANVISELSEDPVSTKYNFINYSAHNFYVSAVVNKPLPRGTLLVNGKFYTDIEKNYDAIFSRAGKENACRFQEKVEPGVYNIELFHPDPALIHSVTGTLVQLTCAREFSYYVGGKIQLTGYGRMIVDEYNVVGGDFFSVKIARRPQFQGQKTLGSDRLCCE